MGIERGAGRVSILSVAEALGNNKGSKETTSEGAQLRAAADVQGVGEPRGRGVSEWDEEDGQAEDGESQSVDSWLPNGAWDQLTRPRRAHHHAPASGGQS